MDFSKLTEGSVHPDLLRFAKYCDELAGDREMPHRHDFNPIDVRWILGSLYVVEVLSAESDYRFKLVGSVVTAIYGKDITGWRLSEIPDSSIHPNMREYLHNNYDAVVTSWAPLFLRGKVLWKKAEINTERLMVPLAEDDGFLSQILVAVHCNIPEDLLAVFRGTGVPNLIPREPGDPHPANASEVSVP